MPSLGRLSRAIRERGLRSVARRGANELCLRAARFFTNRVRLDEARDAYHAMFERFAAEANGLEDYDVMELGSRNRSADYGLRGYRRYVGVDINPGPSVDVVCDAHELSSKFGEEFDVVYCVSVFEHLLMPWKAVVEINRVLRPGGLLFISTHPCWPKHAEPWDFYRFQREAFPGLLNEATGFEILGCEQGLPARIFPLVRERSALGLEREPAHLGVAVLARKIGPVRDGMAWPVTISETVASRYPESGHSYM
jgi:SAM-dependent methyltransferase